MFAIFHDANIPGKPRPALIVITRSISTAKGQQFKYCTPNSSIMSLLNCFNNFKNYIFTHIRVPLVFSFFFERDLF
jgi:hypothetical protein